MPGVLRVVIVGEFVPVAVPPDDDDEEEEGVCVVIVEECAIVGINEDEDEGG